MKKANTKAQQIQQRRAFRVRKKLSGTAERPRMSVVKTTRHIYVQLIDDVQGVTLASASTGGKEHESLGYSRRNKDSAKMVGNEIAKKAKELGIQQVIFDRGARKFHGVFAELAQAARDLGLYC
jgi:large subunit ribosomal protein L18